MTLKVVFLDRKTLGPDIQLRTLNLKHQWIEYQSTHPSAIEKRISDADIVITNKVSLSRDLLAATTQLKLIAVTATGTDIIDIAACNDLGIPVCNVPGYASESVAEYTLAAILGLRRQLFRYQQEVREGMWQASGQFWYFNAAIETLAGSTLGLIGTGNIATKVGNLAEGLGMRILYHSLSGRTASGPGFLSEQLVDLDEIFSSADVISLHCPLNESSNKLVSMARLAQMKSSALLINTARGEIVDLIALEKALKEHLIAGAAIDVAPQEPPESGSVLMRLAQHQNVLVTPHTAWASVTARKTLAEKLLSNIEGFFDGRPQHIVNPETL